MLCIRTGRQSGRPPGHAHQPRQFEAAGRETRRKEGRADERAFWFLGPATYVSHQGEMPMAVTWRLAHPLPGDLFSAFAAAVA